TGGRASRQWQRSTRATDYLARPLQRTAVSTDGWATEQRERADRRVSVPSSSGTKRDLSPAAQDASSRRVAPLDPMPAVSNLPRNLSRSGARQDRARL